MKVKTTKRLLKKHLNKVLFYNRFAIKNLKNYNEKYYLQFQEHLKAERECIYKRCTKVGYIKAHFNNDYYLLRALMNMFIKTDLEYYLTH